ncbi:MAG: hypothetical protein K1X57_15720 [Gemmataceae bacterium]|nr:hypothetical protein [Gemmataceae bacterium]
MSLSTWADPWAAGSLGSKPDGFAGGLTMGMIEAKRADVLRALQLRYRVSVPAELSAAVREMEDLDRLDRWLDTALTAPCLDTFRMVVARTDAAHRCYPVTG